MERKIYIYTCMGCGHEWQSSTEDVICPVCHVADIHEEENDE